jgi:DNA ligase-1
MSVLGNWIYKRDATGAIRAWRYEVVSSKWRTHAGLLDGQHVISGWTTCEPKSQPTAEAQAAFEADAEMRKKLARDYRETIEEVDRPRASVVKPMLAHKYEGWVDGWPCVYTQPKLDGIRCIATAQGLWSRAGKPIVACRHIEEALRPVFAQHPSLILDGELYNHELKDDFNQITSIVRKLKPTEEDSALAREAIQYHVYDVPSHPGVFAERFGWAEMWLELEDPTVVPVATDPVFAERDLNESYERFLAEGYEGQIVRLNTPYEQKRSKGLLKRKEWQDAEFAVVRLEEGNGNWAGYAKRAVLRLPDGREFGAGIKGDQAFTKVLLNGPPPSSATVRFFALTPDGIPRFPVATAFHYGVRM